MLVSEMKKNAERLQQDLHTQSDNRFFSEKISLNLGQFFYVFSRLLCVRWLHTVIVPKSVEFLFFANR